MFFFSALLAAGQRHVDAPSVVEESHTFGTHHRQNDVVCLLTNHAIDCGHGQTVQILKWVTLTHYKCSTSQRFFIGYKIFYKVVLVGVKTPANLLTEGGSKLFSDGENLTVVWRHDVHIGEINDIAFPQNVQDIHDGVRLKPGDNTKTIYWRNP